MHRPQHPCAAHGHAESEVGADERSRQESHVETDQGVLGEAEESRAVGVWLEVRGALATPPAIVCEAGRPF